MLAPAASPVQNACPMMAPTVTPYGFLCAASEGLADMSARALNDVPSQVCIPIVHNVPGSVRNDCRRFWAVLFIFGRFLAWVRSQNTRSVQVPGLVRNIV